MSHYFDDFLFGELDDAMIDDFVSGIAKKFTGSDYHLDKQGQVITKPPPERWLLAVQIKAKPKHPAVLGIARAKSYSKSGQPMNGAFQKSTATIAQVEIVVGSEPDAATVRAALCESTIPDGWGLIHKVLIDLEGKYTVTKNPKWVQGRAEEDAAAAREAQPKKKAVGPKQKANNPMYKKENKK